MSSVPSVKIAYITTIPLTQWSFLIGQNNYMKTMNFELHAISSPGPELEQLTERDGVIAHQVLISRTISPLRDLRTLVFLYLTLRRIRPTIAHVSTPKAALLGSIAACLARVPIRIYLIRGLITENAQGAKRSLFRWLERLTARLCHSSICVAPSLLEFARAEGILGPTQGVVLASGMSNGIDPNRFNPANVEATHLSLPGHGHPYARSRLRSLASSAGLLGTRASRKSIVRGLSYVKNSQIRPPVSGALGGGEQSIGGGSSDAGVRLSCSVGRPRGRCGGILQSHGSVRLSLPRNRGLSERADGGGLHGIARHRDGGGRLYRCCG